MLAKLVLGFGVACCGVVLPVAGGDGVRGGFGGAVFLR